jgi:hypothetical protein
MKNTTIPAADCPTESKPKLRWCHLTPDRCCLGLLIAEAGLFLLESWLPKGFAIVLVLMLIIATILAAISCFAVSLIFHRRFQFTLRSLMLLMLIVAIACSWFSVRVQQAKNQKELVHVLRKESSYYNSAHYDYQYWFNSKPIKTSIAGWLAENFDPDFFGNITWVDLKKTKTSNAGLRCLENLESLQILDLDDTQITDAELRHLENLTKIESIDLNRTNISDSGLKHLKTLTSLKSISLAHTQVTDAGISDLQKALPNLEIKQ